MSTRAQQVTEALERAGLDALFVYSDGASSILRPSHLHYLAGVRPYGRHNAAVVTRKGDAVLLVQPVWDAERLQRQGWIDDVRGVPDFPAAAAELLAGLGVRRLGVAGDAAMPDAVYGSLCGAAELTAADEVVEAMARQDAPAFLELVRKASNVADAGFEAFREHARVGVREYELVAECEYAMRQAGADDNFILMGSSPHNQSMHAPTDRRLVPGDVVIAEISPVCDGLFMQLCRTVVLGEPSPTLREKYGLLEHSFTEALQEVRTGASAANISRRINGILTDAGYGRYCGPPYIRTRGHGFGVGTISPGTVIDDDTDVPLLEQQVVVVHPNQYLPETGYLACGETVLVTGNGPERLSRTSGALHVNPA